MDDDGTSSADDQELLNRLNALKPSSVSIDTRPRIAPRSALSSSNVEDGLFADRSGNQHVDTLSATNRSPDASDNGDQEDLQKLLEELKEVTAKTELRPSDLRDAKVLEAEAKELLNKTSDTHDLPDHKEGEHESDNEDESMDVLDRILEESRDEDIVNSSRPSRKTSEDVEPAPEKRTSPPTDSFASLQFPEVPPDSAFDDLMLPSAPTAAPTSTKIQASKGPGNDLVETWCIICCANASVRCFGCDKDLYCWGCWREGHMGESAGLEGRQHVWERYKKPR